MKETVRHQEAFDFYYGLGVHRGYTACAREFDVARTSIARWGKEFNWQKRIEQRDIENSKRLEKKTNTVVVNEKAKAMKWVEDRLRTAELRNQYLVRALSSALTEDKDGKKVLKKELEIKSLRDLADINKAINDTDKGGIELHKLTQLIMGEPDSRPDTNITIVTGIQRPEDWEKE